MDSVGWLVAIVVALLLAMLITWLTMKNEQPIRAQWCCYWLPEDRGGMCGPCRWLSDVRDA